MSVKIAHARIGENGTIEGTAGDQTGHEVEISDWYSGGWVAVYRPNSEIIANVIAFSAEEIADNNCIGYSQTDRTSLHRYAALHNYNFGGITEPCNTDCSAMVAVCVNSAGVPVSKDMTTRNEDTVLMGTGEFTRLTSTKYLQDSQYLKRGDILKKKGHTAIVVSSGEHAADDVYRNHTPIYADYKDDELAGKYTATDDVYMREGASTTYRAMTVVYGGNPVYCYGYYSVDNRGVRWIYCEYVLNGIKYTGFVSSKYLERTGAI